MTDERRALINRVVKNAYELIPVEKALAFKARNRKEIPWFRSVAKWDVYERTAILEYAKLLRMFPEVDPKDLLIDYRSHFLEESESGGPELYFWASNGLTRLAYYLGFEDD